MEGAAASPDRWVVPGAGRGRRVGLWRVLLATCLLGAGCSDSLSEESDTGSDDLGDPRCDGGGPCEHIGPPGDAGNEPDGAPRLDGGLTDGPRMDATGSDAVAHDASTADAGSRDGGPGTLPLPTCANINERLRSDLGIVIQPGTLPYGGLPSEDIGCADRIKVYQMFLLPFATATVVRYVLRKEFLLDLRGLRRDTPRERQAPPGPK